MAGSPDKDEIIARIQQREQEQSLLFSLCESLAPVTTRKEFHDVVSNVVKSTIGFNHFSICIEDEPRKGYRLQYHSTPADYTKHKTTLFTDSSAIFASALNSPEPAVISKSDAAKAPGLPSFLKEALQLYSFSLVSVALSSKYCKGVAFFGFGRGNEPERNTQRLIKMLSLQLGITLTNILLFEKAIPGITIPEPEIQDMAQANDMGIIGKSAAMQQVRSLITLVSGSNSGVLILGESGTGKELVAKAIHDNSARSMQPLIKVNCAAIPENLLESELFGHEKGSFTGAIAQKKGKFEQADKGTLFLDEIGDMPMELQVKLLRALQEREIQRIGGNGSIIADTRIIAATNRDLQEEVKKGNFRADLYYRLNVFAIEVPALRERTEDIPDLASFFIQRNAVRNKKPLKTIAVKALNTLRVYPWPGNIRELEHALERAFLLTPDKVIKEVQITNNKDIATPGNAIKPWYEFEKEYILTVLKFCNGKISGASGAAALLEMPPTTLKSKMERLGIKKRHYSAGQ
ncbi:sigma-54 dependent transcriptional regulator [Flavobacterium sp. DGU11]|uniref:Sigma-54 dependent transcriptional regulator n=1 Tax=Flavobacterium arundinis TaxID=3139143 RepID=A0ABU9HXQ7_9FLAO